MYGWSVFKTQRGLLLAGLGCFWIGIGFFLEWTIRNQIGSIHVDNRGLRCFLPWGRQRYLLWNEIREVRCTTRRFYREFSFWEIRGVTPEQRVTFTWQLKRYKQLLWLIRQHAPQLQRFDPEPDDLEPVQEK